VGCSVCSRTDRASIETAVEEPGADLHAVAERYRVTVAGLRRHLAHPRANAEGPPVLRSRRAPTTEPSLRARLPRERSISGAARAPREAPSKPAAARRRDDADGRVRTTPPPPLEDAAPPTSRSEEISGRALSRRGVSIALSARESVVRLVSSLQELVDEVRRSDEAALGDKIAVLRAMTGPLRLLGTMTGELGANDATVAASPFYRRVRAALLEALKPHPAATQDVIAALERVERGGIESSEAAAE